MTCSPQTIGLALPRAAHQEAFVEGVFQYASKRERNWSYLVAPESLSLSVRDLVNWSGDGVISSIGTVQEAHVASNFHLPIVNVDSTLAESPVPRSMVDNYAIGALAAEHFLERGFYSYAFYGIHDVEYSRLRLKGFNDVLATVGFVAVEFTLPSANRLQGDLWSKQQQDLTNWLATLETPCGIFAASDVRARQVINCSGRLKLKIPEQIAVVGVDDQRIICELAHPTISSIARDRVLEGYKAASLLDDLMHGKSINCGDRLIPPRYVVARESTATFAVPDERLRKVMVYIRSRIEDPITINEVCDHINVSRRWLEYSFRGILGETPYQYIRRQRLELVQRLLTEEPDAKIYRIAERVGFSSAKQLAKVFRREFGMSPRNFRQSVECQ